jgi:transcriptional/translational regulatory protein YebC/TACO1
MRKPGKVRVFFLEFKFWKFKLIHYICSVNLINNKMENAFTEEALDQGVQLTPEEIATRKQEMLDFYKEQIEFMKVQHEFEKLSADIEDERLRRMVAMIRQAQLQSPPSEEEETEQPSAPKKRALKTN